MVKMNLDDLLLFDASKEGKSDPNHTLPNGGGLYNGDESHGTKS